MKEISLGKTGYITLIDDEDYELISKYTWTTLKTKWSTYAMTSTKPKIAMHRLLLNAPKGVLVDHRDSDGLNNQRHNIRLATPLQNSQNYQKPRVEKTSQYKGVSWDSTKKRIKRWRAQIRVNKHSIALGYYATELEAAIAYNKAALKYHGEFANLNKID